VTIINNERRQSKRYQLSDVAVIGIISPMSSAPEIIDDIRTTDFNAFGIGIETRAQLSIGDTLSLAIKTGNEKTSIITASVCNCATTDGKSNRYGMLFDYSSELNNSSVNTHLKSIETKAKPQQETFSF
jgi:hypothetical protein